MPILIIAQSVQGKPLVVIESHSSCFEWRVCSRLVGRQSENSQRKMPRRSTEGAGCLPSPGRSNTEEEVRANGDYCFYYRYVHHLKTLCRRLLGEAQSKACDNSQTSVQLTNCFPLAKSRENHLAKCTKCPESLAGKMPVLKPGYGLPRPHPLLCGHKSNQQINCRL